MCTVTYLPLRNKEVILTSNRDEFPNRNTNKAPTSQWANNTEVIYPEDSTSKGTWICAGDHKIICLLNGAFENYSHTQNYRHSRGVIPISYFDYENTEDFWNKLNLENIAPFTLVVVDNRNTPTVFDLRWDGTQKHYLKLDPQEPAIWCSPTLYTANDQANRTRWFDNFLKNKDISESSILDFHLNAGEQDPEKKLVMKRPSGIQTVSITSVLDSPSKMEMRQYDLVNNVNYSTEIV